MSDGAYRRTTQHLAPASGWRAPEDAYDIYPTFPVAAGSIGRGHEALVRWIAGRAESGVVRIDGYVGVLWDDLRARLEVELRRLGRSPTWVDVGDALRPAAEVEALVAPFLGGDDPLFGRRATIELRQLFDERLRALAAASPGEPTILYGCGAGLVDREGPLVYVDLPKNELQFRSRAGVVRNLGADEPLPPRPQYKRFYFVDWVLLNAHKAALAGRVDLFVDGQRRDEPLCLDGDEVRAALRRMARNAFRARPWFEPGPWGGQWIRRNVPGLSADVPNYAWSFELIAPENGLVLRDGERLLELSFDWLMFREHEAVLGASADRFGHEFPIRFDFLDTFDGGNLSLQCHPRPAYARERFGERMTQDESYYILDAQPGARVYLGFVAGVDPRALRAALEASERGGSPVDVERFVRTEPARRHDLFLIPGGTVHCSGAGNLVLEISSTPYIFTFKMYDWLRLDLEGRPRPLNVERAFENLRFERQGERAARELVARPRVVGHGDGWRVVHLPTHAEHFYDVRRYELERAVEVETRGSCQVMSLVEGSAIEVETAGGMRLRFHRAETFVVPAAAGRVRLVNRGRGPAFVVSAFVKDRKDRVDRVDRP